jgi:hypothetical protein
MLLCRTCLNLLCNRQIPLVGVLIKGTRSIRIQISCANAYGSSNLDQLLLERNEMRPRAVIFAARLRPIITPYIPITPTHFLHMHAPRHTTHKTQMHFYSQLDCAGFMWEDFWLRRQQKRTTIVWKFSQIPIL